MCHPNVKFRVVYIAQSGAAFFACDQRHMLTGPDLGEQYLLFAYPHQARCVFKPTLWLSVQGGEQPGIPQEVIVDRRKSDAGTIRRKGRAHLLKDRRP